MHEVWSRSLPVHKAPNDIFPDAPRAPRTIFHPSFETKEDPPMGLLIGWEYGRLWLREREAFILEMKLEAKENFIEPDFGWWLKKHCPQARRKAYRRRPAQPLSNLNLSAFAKIKESRRKHIVGREERLAKSAKNQSEEESKQCCCKDCKRMLMRSAGGRQQTAPMTTTWAGQQVAIKLRESTMNTLRQLDRKR